MIKSDETVRSQQKEDEGGWQSKMIRNLKNNTSKEERKKIMKIYLPSYKVETPLIKAFLL